MSMVAFRIPDEMKEQMDKAGINWSEYIRRAINEALHSQTKRALMSQIHGWAQDRKKKVPAGSSVKIIRQMRDHA